MGVGSSPCPPVLVRDAHGHRAHFSPAACLKPRLPTFSCPFSPSVIGAHRTACRRVSRILCLLQLPICVPGSSSRFPGCGLVHALNHRASAQIICSFSMFKGFSYSLLWRVLECIWKCGFLSAEGSPTSLVAHAPHFTQCISSNIHQTFTVNTWCWRTGFHPEKINTPNQTHSTLKTLINPYYRLKLYRNAKSHCPILCLGKLGRATSLRLPRARRQKLT